MTKPIRIASRRSQLALWQANTVGKMLNREYEIIEISTSGDDKKDTPIFELGGVGVFAKEIQNAVLNNSADIAVHSAKDLMTLTPSGLKLSSIPLRGDVRDILIGSTFNDLPYGAKIGTGAQRRRAQLSILRPDLQFGELRGNIEKRISKAKDFDAIVLANVALQRLSIEPGISEIFDIDVMLPQVGQGALAIEVRNDDNYAIDITNEINDYDSYRCVMAERSFLRVLGGGCSIPCAAYCIPMDSNTLWLRAMLSDYNGRQSIFVESTGGDPEQLGINVARELLDNRGGAELMELVV
ncbi:MAG: hydroxymethylbilane synthase [Acidimicrobiia bacterium]|nr:hydroxymethylbilane synthase [Acidimicrobiia bacterium]